MPFTSGKKIKNKRGKIGINIKNRRRGGYFVGGGGGWGCGDGEVRSPSPLKNAQRGGGTFCTGKCLCILGAHRAPLGHQKLIKSEKI